MHVQRFELLPQKVVGSHPVRVMCHHLALADFYPELGCCGLHGRLGPQNQVHPLLSKAGMLWATWETGTTQPVSSTSIQRCDAMGYMSGWDHTTKLHPLHFRVVLESRDQKPHVPTYPCLVNTRITMRVVVVCGHVKLFQNGMDFDSLMTCHSHYLFIIT